MASHRHGSGGDGHQDTYDVAQVGTEDPGVSQNSSLGQAVEEAPEEAGQGHEGPISASRSLLQGPSGASVIRLKPQKSSLFLENYLLHQGQHNHFAKRKVEKVIEASAI